MSSIEGVTIGEFVVVTHGTDLEPLEPPFARDLRLAALGKGRID
jgi:hypothetical protein